MTTPKEDSLIIRYADGQKMTRIAFDINSEIAIDFKKILNEEGRSLTSVLRPVIINYINSKKSPVPNPINVR